MPESIRINLHGHSQLSDGELTPDQLAERLAAAGVRTAALTDHDTIEGLPAFREALTRKGVGFVTGVELTVADPEEGEKHILGYGFDPGNKALRDLLGRAAGNRRPSYLQALSSAFDKSRSSADRPDAAGGRTAAGTISPAEAIHILHEAGGLAVLAHPVVPGQKPDFAALERLISRLKAQGLDGIEAFYSGYSEDLSRDLVALAGRHDLLVSAGSDYHGPGLPGFTELAVDMPLALWRSFRDGLLRRAGTPGRPVPRESAEHRPLPRPRWNSFLFKILLPTALAIGLFVVFLFRVLIPAFEDRLLERKRDTIRELTNVASGILAEYDVDVRAGRLSLVEAQKTAAGRIRDLRYGNEAKDYFWITDMQVRMIMHPYRTDLNGRDVSDFKDPRGVRIFVEFANILRDRDEAYVEYVWQWKDNPDRLEPKQSFIKKFAPWGWILGTGIYLEDVHREIQAMAARLVRVSIGITVLCAMLLLFVATQSMRIERRRAKAEDELRESHEKYRTLVESATEGTLMVLDGRPAFANPTMLDLIDVTEDELRLLDLVEVLPEGFVARIPGANGVRAEEAVLKRRDGSGVDVALTVTRISFAGREGVVISARPLRSRRRGEAAAFARDRDRENLLSDLQASLMFLHEPVAPLAGLPVFCDIRDPVSKGASLMTARGASAVVVTADGEPVGLVTDTDIRARLVAGGLPSDSPLLSIMSAPLVSIEARALVYEAILAMREKDVDHLIVRDETGKVAGVVRHRELLLFHRYSLAVLTQEIRHAPSAEAIAAARRGLPNLVKVLVEGGAKARNITRAVTAVTDAVVIRLLELAAAGLGPAPARFSFIALGSEGREEQTLATDQDHAIIFEDVPEEAVADVQAYFLKLGKFVSDGLALAGYPLCLGEIMSGNPRWCQPLRVWKGNFAEWLRTAEPKDILDLKIFFDFRTIHGEVEFAAELRRHIDEVLGQEPPFLLHYAQYTLQYKAPLSFFGHIVLEEGKEGLRTFNIKDAMMPVVNFARLYAFRHGVPGVNTMDRLHALLDVGALREMLHDEAVKVYDYLMELRLAHQVRALDRNEVPGNDIDPRELTHIEETLLKQVFAQIANIQKKISFDFLGSA